MNPDRWAQKLFQVPLSITHPCTFDLHMKMRLGIIHGQDLDTAIRLQSHSFGMAALLEEEPTSLDLLDAAVLSQTDEEYVRLTWDKVKQIIGDSIIIIIRVQY
jgi:hypothetical protein